MLWHMGAWTKPQLMHLKYVTEDMAMLSARDILDAKDARQWESRLAELVNDGNAIRVDRLSLVVDRVIKETESRFGAFQRTIGEIYEILLLIVGKDLRISCTNACWQLTLGRRNLSQHQS